MVTDLSWFYQALFLFINWNCRRHTESHLKEVDCQARVVLLFLTDYGPLSGNSPDVLSVRTGYMGHWVWKRSAVRAHTLTLARHPALQWCPAFLVWRKIPTCFFLLPHPFLTTLLLMYQGRGLILDAHMRTMLVVKASIWLCGNLYLQLMHICLSLLSTHIFLYLQSEKSAIIPT